MNAVYVVEAVRTPVGKFGGSLAQVRPDDLGALVIKALMSRLPDFDPMLIEDVIFGAANQAGEDNRNVARMSALLAGLPVEVPGITVNRLCASGLQAIGDAYRQIAIGDAEAIIAGGVESMTRAPFVMAKAETAFSRTPEIYDTTIGWRFTNPALSALYHPFSMGETAENVAERWKVSREDQDQFAFDSQSKYARAHEVNRFQEELVPVMVKSGKNLIEFNKDEHPRLSALEKLAELKPAFRKNGTVTAGNASGINDGAAALMLVSETILKRYNLTPLARVVGVAAAGVDPAVMGIGPVPATQKLLKKSGITVNQLDLVELNEAFASQALACMRDLELNPDIVNVNGGSIAIGHPLGASGARISTTLLHEMKKRKARFGLATMCIGVGQGVAVLYEGIH